MAEIGVLSLQIRIWLPHLSILVSFHLRGDDDMPSPCIPVFPETGPKSLLTCSR